LNSVAARAREFGGLEFARREIDESQADWGAGGVRGYRGEEIIFAGVEDGDICGGAGGDDADDFAADDFFSGAWLLHLIADGDFESGADQASDVAFGGVVGDAAHGDGLAFFAIAGGERDLQFAGGEDGVFVEEFVKVAQAEEQEGVGITGFDRLVLLHQWCSGIRHGSSRRPDAKE
jgi:hypothetical protein